MSASGVRAKSMWHGWNKQWNIDLVERKRKGGSPYDSVLLVGTSNCRSTKQCHHTHWPARAAFQLHRSNYRNRARCWCPLQVRDVFNLVDSMGQRVLMYLEVLRRAVVDAQRIDAQAKHAACSHQKFSRIQRVSRKVHHSLGVSAAITIGKFPAGVPPRACHDHTALRDLSVCFLPMRDVLNREAVIGVIPYLFCDIDYH